ncbi:MAG: DUF411 domain-containing protein [Luteitalea sp.]|nr:DUF411 domain-containing protein [Luteitalea sp.]
MLLVSPARIFTRVLLLVSITAVAAMAQKAEKPVPVTVYKTATCGCCAKWNDHLSANGFDVTSKDVEYDALETIKDQHSVPDSMRSCHTAIVGDYVVEGHVPADVVRKLLQERPKVPGIAVPGMPMGSPGMEGFRKDAYDVLTFDAQGKTSVFASR